MLVLTLSIVVLVVALLLGHSKNFSDDDDDDALRWQSTGHHTCCVHVKRHTTVNRMTGDDVVGSQRQAGNRLTSMTVLGRLDIERPGQ